MAIWGDGGGWSLKGKVEPRRIEPITPTPTSSPRPALAHGNSSPGFEMLLVVVSFLLSSHIPMFQPTNFEDVRPHGFGAYGRNQHRTHLRRAGRM